MCLGPSSATIREGKTGIYLICATCIGRVFVGPSAARAFDAVVPGLAGRYWRGEPPGLPARATLRPEAMRCVLCGESGLFLRFDKYGRPWWRTACCRSTGFVHDRLGTTALIYINPEAASLLGGLSQGTVTSATATAAPTRRAASSEGSP
jgi:hypothetical protein